MGADTTVPNVVGQTREAAEDRLADLGFTFRTVGDGDTVTDQTPAGGAIVPGNASIILYLGQEKPDTPCTVPNVVGMTLEDAKKERYIWFTPLNDWAKVTPFGVLFFGAEELMSWETLCEEWGYRFKAYRRPPEGEDGDANHA